MPASIVAAVVGLAMGAAEVGIGTILVTTAIIGGVVAAIQGKDILQGAIGGALGGLAGGTLGAGMAAATAAPTTLAGGSTGSVLTSGTQLPMTSAQAGSLAAPSPALVPTMAANVAAPTTIPGSFMGGVQQLWSPVTSQLTGSGSLLGGNKQLVQTTLADGSTAFVEQGGGGLNANNLAGIGMLAGLFKQPSELEDAQAAKYKQEVANIENSRSADVSGGTITSNDFRIQRTPIPTQGNANPYLLKQYNGGVA